MKNRNVINIPINEAETIFEPFYDGGESYPDHEKYPRLNNYTVSYAEGTVAKVEQTWSAVNILIQSQTTQTYSVKLERSCDLEIQGYDRFRLFAAVPENITFCIRCTIDGQSQVVMEKTGLGDTCEYDGIIWGRRITHYSLEFCQKGKETVSINLEWLGLANSERQSVMESKKSPFQESWEGCFCENPVMEPMIGICFTTDELNALRERLGKAPFLKIVDTLRKRAEAAMLLEPEPHIAEYVPPNDKNDRRWVRDRDYKRPNFLKDMEVLAFIGLLDQNMEMLRMACRKMLSIAVTPCWTESIMGCLPGATWHHRSFTEDRLCSAVALVLDWAGNILTWHGKNIVYDALMLKGLPRLMSDFYSVEYIREMNQGIVFNHGRVLALLALSHRYPRFEAMLTEAANDEREMIDRYIMEDGGTLEGPHYWNYTFEHSLLTIALLARHENKTLEEYAWGKLKQTGEFALTMLSDVQDGTCILPVNDAHMVRYSPVVCAIFKRISKDPRWRLIYNKVITEVNEENADLMTVLFSSDIEPVDMELFYDKFQSSDRVGHTSLRRMTDDVGCVHCYLSGGPNYHAHCHGDKGQILMEVDRIPILIDRGICVYSNPLVNVLDKAKMHNLFIPEASEGVMSYEQDVLGPGARIVRSSYENGVLDYCTDTLGAWPPGILQSIKRSVKSDNPHEYFIYDDAEFLEETGSSFRLHTYGKITQQENSWSIEEGGYEITVTPINYTPAYAEYGEEGVDGEMKPVNSLRLYLPKAMEQHIITSLKVGLATQKK